MARRPAKRRPAREHGQSGVLRRCGRHSGAGCAPANARVRRGPRFRHRHTQVDAARTASISHVRVREDGRRCESRRRVRHPVLAEALSPQHAARERHLVSRRQGSPGGWDLQLTRVPGGQAHLDPERRRLLLPACQGGRTATQPRGARSVDLCIVGVGHLPNGARAPGPFGERRPDHCRLVPPEVPAHLPSRPPGDVRRGDAGCVGCGAPVLRMAIRQRCDGRKPCKPVSGTFALRASWRYRSAAGIGGGRGQASDDRHAPGIALGERRRGGRDRRVDRGQARARASACMRNPET